MWVDSRFLDLEENSESAVFQEVAADIKPFCLRFSDSRECSALYKLIAGLQSGVLHHTQISDPGSANSSMTTTTTTVDTSANTHTTTTTTTVVSQVKGQPGQTIKSTSHKLVLQASSLKQLNNMRKTASTILGKSQSPRQSPSSSGPSSANPSPGKVVIQHQEVREVVVPEDKKQETLPKSPNWLNIDFFIFRGFLGNFLKNWWLKKNVFSLNFFEFFWTWSFEKNSKKLEKLKKKIFFN